MQQPSPTCIKLNPYKMKILTLIAFFAFSNLAGLDIYSIRFPDYNGTQVNMSIYRNKKIIITAFNAKSPDISFLRYLNQLQIKYPSVQVIAIPATDFAGLENIAELGKLKDTEKLRIIIGKPSLVQQKNTKQQHPLFQWLTQKEQNNHFNIDVESTEQLYLVSSKGTLYAVLDKMTTSKKKKKTLNQRVD